MPITQYRGRSLYLHTHPIEHLRPEPYPLNTFNYPANSKYIICHHLQQFPFFFFFCFLLVSLCDNDLYMDRVQTIWKMSDSRLKSSSKPNWSSVATIKHQERGIFEAIPQPRPARRPSLSGCRIVPSSPLMAQTTTTSFGSRAGQMRFQQGPAL